MVRLTVAGVVALGRGVPSREEEREELERLRAAEWFWYKIEAAGEFEVIRAIPVTAARQRAQRGLFTRLRSETHQDVESYLKSRNLAHCWKCTEFQVALRLMHSGTLNS